jgi:hypothetical protein
MVPCPCIHCAQKLGLGCDSLRAQFSSVVCDVPWCPRRASYPCIAACDSPTTPPFHGGIGGPGPLATICDEGWQVCTGTQIAVSGLTYSMATSFAGCYGYDSAQDCGACFATCASSRGAAAGGCTVVRGLGPGCESHHLSSIEFHVKRFALCACSCRNYYPLSDNGPERPRTGWHGQWMRVQELHGHVLPRWVRSCGRGQRTHFPNVGLLQW